MIRKKKILATALCAGGVVLSAVMAQEVTEPTTTPTTETGTTATGTTTETDATVTTLVSQPFNTAVDSVTSLNKDDATALSGTWAGYGSVTNQTGDGAGYAKPANGVGTPINDATDKLYLSVDGYVTCTAATTASKPATVDMMIQIARPDEALAMPTGETTAGIQIAVGVDSDGSLKVYCKNGDGTADWYSLGATTYEEGSWHRVSFTFDYAHQRCQIRLDGEPLMTSNGTLTSDGATTATAAGSAAIGSWYKLNASEATALSSVKVVGSTAIDEVVITEATTVAAALPVLADASSETADGVPYSWIEQQGITRAQAAGDAPDNSKMKVAAKYKTGLPIGDGKTFAISAMGMTGDGANLKATLTVPAMTPPDGYKNVIVYGSSPTELTSSVDVASSASEQTVELSVSKAAAGVTKIYYQLKNVSTVD